MIEKAIELLASIGCYSGQGKIFDSTDPLEMQAIAFLVSENLVDAFDGEVTLSNRGEELVNKFILRR